MEFHVLWQVGDLLTNLDKLLQLDAGVLELAVTLGIFDFIPVL